MGMLSHKTFILLPLSISPTKVCRAMAMFMASISVMFDREPMSWYISAAYAYLWEAAPIPLRQASTTISRTGEVLGKRATPFHSVAKSRNQKRLLRIELFTFVQKAGYKEASGSDAFSYVEQLSNYGLELLARN